MSIQYEVKAHHEIKSLDIYNMNCTVNSLDIQYGVNSLYIRYDSEVNSLDKQHEVNSLDNYTILK